MVLLASITILDKEEEEEEEILLLVLSHLITWDSHYVRFVQSLSLSLSGLGYILISVLSYVSSLREKEMFLINGLHRVRKNVPIT